jgi:hypothetical protein
VVELRCNTSLRLLLHTEQGHAKHWLAKLSGVWCVRVVLPTADCGAAWQGCVAPFCSGPGRSGVLYNSRAPARRTVPVRQVSARLETTCAGLKLAWHALRPPASPLHSTGLSPRDLYEGGACLHTL